jgi:hypothetical protein
MTPPPVTEELAGLARRIIWFEPPAAALADPIRFLAYLMTYGTPDDLRVARRYFSQADFREAVENAPPGIFDARSWAYWNLKAGRYPAPPLPARRLPD